MLVLAKQRGLIISVEALDALIDSGLWLGEPLLNMLLEQANEK